jgi:predicted Zn-dependent peptidase
LASAIPIADEKPDGDRMKRIKTGFSLLLLVLCWIPAVAQDLASFEKRVTVSKLPNGLTVILCRRPEAPVFSFATWVDSGSSQDPLHMTGLAHMMEHMAFKGTDKVGTTDYPAEKAALAEVESAYAAYRAERIKPTGADPKKVAELEKAWKDAITRADKYVVKGEFDEIVQRAGGVGLNAFTTYDETVYFYSMPINRLGLWAYLESERFTHPVMREFYKERDVVMEERRMRTDSDPTQRMIEQFLSIAFDANPYHRPTIGYMSDLQYFSATDAMNFFKSHYVPSNLVIAVVGDLDPATAMPIIAKYFGRIPSASKPEEFVSTQPAQGAERSVLVKDPSQPIYIEGYHRPSYRDPDDAVYDAISDLLSSGRTSRLFRSMVRDQKIAAAAGGFSPFPGEKYPHLFAFYAVPLPGHTPEEMKQSIHEEIERLKTQDVSDDELRMVKTRAKATLIRGLASNSGLAQQLADAQTRYGDWRELFRQVDRIDKVTKQDIRRVANSTFIETNRTVGAIETTPPAENGKEHE